MCPSRSFKHESHIHMTNTQAKGDCLWPGHFGESRISLNSTLSLRRCHLLLALGLQQAEVSNISLDRFLATAIERRLLGPN